MARKTDEIVQRTRDGGKIVGASQNWLGILCTCQRRDSNGGCLPQDKNGCCLAQLILRSEFSINGLYVGVPVVIGAKSENCRN